MSRRKGPEAYGIPADAGLGVVALWAATAAPKGRKRSTPAPSKVRHMIAPGPPGRWAVDFPGWTPPSLNTLMRWHPMKRHREGEKVDQMAGIACLAAGVARAAGRRRVHLTLTVPKGRPRLDRDNAVKMLLDALVTCGALVDDGPDHLEAATVGYAVGARGTTVVIEDTQTGETS